MSQLSIVQEYVLCALPSQGAATVVTSTETTLCLVVGALTELMQDGYVQLNDQKLASVAKELSNNKVYAEPLYRYVQENQPVQVEAIAEHYTFGSNNSDELFNSICASL